SPMHGVDAFRRLRGLLGVAERERQHGIERPPQPLVRLAGEVAVLGHRGSDFRAGELHQEGPPPADEHRRLAVHPPRDAAGLEQAIDTSGCAFTEMTGVKTAAGSIGIPSRQTVPMWPQTLIAVCTAWATPVHSNEDLGPRGSIVSVLHHGSSATGSNTTSQPS